ncbi:MAG TPA: TonB-dependent receptor plug domain-containing protein [Candidatus Synoicihabitans sp.]|nr:TonB-dependent receptor plug domain-containing protein [Candidatus Synoicihabitans sp.]
MNYTSRLRTSRSRRWFTLAALLGLPLSAQQVRETTEADPPVDGSRLNPTTGVASPLPDDGTVRLSPFEVRQSNRDIGYYAENTLAGSRLNTNVGDLAASITIVTKQQLEDTGALDINDVFLFEANTEGAGTYTPVALNRNNVTDNIGGWSGDDGSPFGIATANRIRGLGRADTAQNNHPTIARWAFDTYNTNSVEISRGPNSLLFGTGSPAGIVNQSTSEAVLGRQHTTVSARLGSFGAKRGSIATNVPLGDKVAIYASALWDDRGFQRKPSYDKYRRQYLAATFQPWRKTKITAAFENYDNRNNRPNFLPPQDLVTPWLQAGKPGWNPYTQRITFADGRVTAPYLQTTADARYVAGVTPSADGDLTNTQSPFFINGIQFHGRNTLYIDQGEMVTFWVPNGASGSTTAQLPTSATARTQMQREIAARRTTWSRGPLVPIPPASTGATQYGGWLAPHITDQSLYDWEEHNASGANYGTQEGKMYNIELQQEILPNLHFSAGWFRQEFDEWTHYGLGQANQAPRIYIDTNTHYIDGTPNPYFGSPYVIDWQADSFYRPETNDSTRAMLAYELDFTKNDGWTRWLGSHRFLGLASRQDQWTNNLRYRLSFQGGDQRFLPLARMQTNTHRWGLDAASIQRAYYLGQNQNATVERGVDVFGNPGFGGPSNATLNFYDWTTGAYNSTEMEMGMNLLYAGNNYGVNKRRTDSVNFAWQGYLWENRIIPTLGWRTDEVTLSAYNGRTPDQSRTWTDQELYVDGFGVPTYANVTGPERTVKGDTSTRGVVTRPFSNWSGIDSAANSGNFFADFVRGLSFHYNESDNFNAPPGLQVDFFNRPLPTPSGEGKDYGVGVSLFDNKLVLRLNWYEATNKFAPSSAAGTAISRAQRMDTNTTRRWAEYIVRIQDGQDPRTDLEFHNNTQNPLTEAQEQRISQLVWGDFELGSYNWPGSGTYSGSINGTESNVSKGKELQIIYNPLRNWNMKLTVGQQKASYSDALAELKEWVDFRRPHWESLSAVGLIPDEFLGEIRRANGDLLRLDNYWTAYGFTDNTFFDDAPSSTTQFTGTPSSAFTTVFESEYFPLVAKQNTSSENLREWTANFITNYAFQEGFLRGFAVGGTVRWQDKAVGGYYGLEDPSTYARPNATTAIMVFPDLSRPIYTPAETNVDFVVSYTRKIFEDRVRMKIQLNVRDAFESGGLQVVAFNKDGSPAQYRIKDPRTFFVTTTFDF